MAATKQNEVRDADIRGMKYLRDFMSLVKPLRGVGCERDKARNRKLHFDQYAGLILLFLFNPTVSSLRGLKQASELNKVQRMLGCARASLGSMSESVTVFEPERIREIIKQLSAKLPTVPHDRQLDQIKHALIAVDGSLLRTLPQITQATYKTQKNGVGGKGWRLHAQFEILRGVPVRADVTDAKNSKASNEKNVLRAGLQPNCCYITDRGYEQFSLFNEIDGAGSSYVARIREDHPLHDEKPLSISPAALDAGVLSDSVGRLGSPKSKRIEHTNHCVRLIRIRVEPHPKRGGKRRKSASKDLVIATNLLHVPAEVIALIYRHRWMVEIFFRFFKHILGCRHLLSQKQNGIEIQTYCAIIACMLISLWTNRKPTLRTYEMICHYFTGLADEDELLAHIANLKPVNQS